MRISEWCLMGGKVLTEPSERPVPGVRGERRGWEVACGLFLLPGKKARSRTGADVGVRGGKVGVLFGGGGEVGPGWVVVSRLCGCCCCCC